MLVLVLVLVQDGIRNILLGSRSSMTSSLEAAFRAQKEEEEEQDDSERMAGYLIQEEEEVVLVLEDTVAASSVNGSVAIALSVSAEIGVIWSCPSGSAIITGCRLFVSHGMIGDDDRLSLLLLLVVVVVVVLVVVGVVVGDAVASGT